MKLLDILEREINYMSLDNRIAIAHILHDNVQIFYRIRWMIKA